MKLENFSIVHVPLNRSDQIGYISQDFQRALGGGGYSQS